MARAFYEIWKCNEDFTDEIQQIYFKKVDVKKEMMKISSFYFDIKRNAQTMLDAPALGDSIKIIRNNEEVLRGHIKEMEVRENTIHYEGFSIAADWKKISDESWSFRNTETSYFVGLMGKKIGWEKRDVEVLDIENHDYTYNPLIEELEWVANLVGREFLLSDVEKVFDFKKEVGTDKSSYVRFVRGVNIDSLTINRDKADSWTKVIALGAGEGKNQLKVVVGDDTGDTKVFTDKDIKTKSDLTNFANSKLKEGNGTDTVTYECAVTSPIFGLEIGDKIWVEDSKNRIDEPMRIMSVEMTFDKTEQFKVVLANKNKTLVDLFKKMEKGQRTLENVHHSSAVQPNTMIQVDPESKDPIKLEVEDDNFVNSSSGNSIGQIEQNVTTAQSTADNAKVEAIEAKDTAEFAVTGVLELDEKQEIDRITQSLFAMGFGVPENVKPPVFTRPAPIDFYGATYEIDEPRYISGGIVIDKAVEENIEITTNAVINPKEGTIEFTFTPLQLDNWNNFFRMSIPQGRFTFYYGLNGWCEFGIGGTGEGVRTESGFIKVGQTYDVALRWSDNSGLLSLFVNGELIGTKRYQPMTEIPEKVDVTNGLSVILHDLRISMRARTDKEIIRARQVK
ncbi:hypothetical protein ABE236_18050 [Priestia endophytica]|uniref:Gp37-like protein n=1 Tax=Priestia endophytica TaxID=135735 RepID=UPI003D2C1E40